MDKADKYPTLDPNVRGIYDVLIAAVGEERRRRKSDEYRQAEQRRALADKLRREARELQARELETAREAAERLAAERLAAAKKLPGFIEFRDSNLGSSRTPPQD